MDKAKKHGSLKKGEKFIVLGEAKNQEKVAIKDVGVEVIAEKMKLIYFKLGAMICRAPRSAFSGRIE